MSLDSLERFADAVRIATAGRVNCRAVLALDFAPDGAALHMVQNALPDAQVTAGDPGAPSPEGPPPDLIMVRRPDVALRREAWDTGLHAALVELVEGGVLLATTDLLPDAAFIDEIVRSVGLRMRPGTPYSAVAVAFDGSDRYILIYDK